MGCSMGGGLAIDFALAHPERTKSLILVGSGPAGLELDTNDPEDLFEAAGKAYEANDLDLAAEIETQIWFDGQNRTADDVDPIMRKLAYEMNRLALEHEAKKLGKHIRKEGTPAVERLNELTMPVLIIIGQNDIPYLLAAADYMEKHLAHAKKVLLPNAAHLPNMEQPQAFREVLDSFLV
jgi:pimeloyl-ACP methyl ester carboxylesterase